MERSGASPEKLGQGGVPLRRLLVAAALALALPLLAVAAISAWSNTQRERSRFDAQLVATSRALALALDREFALATAVLQGLSVLPQLADGDLLVFDDIARRTVANQFTAVLFDAEGRTRINTALPRDERVLAAIPQTNPALVARTLTEGGPVVSDVFVGASGRHVVAITLRTEVVGAPAVLAVAIWSERLGDVLRQQQMPERWVAAVLDRRLAVAARTRAEAEFVGRPATPPVRDLLGRTDSGVIRSIPTHDGMQSVVAAARAPQSGFSVAMAAPVPYAWMDALAVLSLPALSGLLLLVAALGGIRAVGTRLLRGIARLAPGAGGGGEPSGIRELDDAADRLRLAEAARAEASRRLADSEERYRIASEAFAGGVYECRPLENRVLRSFGLLRLLGEERDEPHRDWWFSRVHPDDLRNLQSAYGRAKAGGQDSFEIEYRMRHRDGHFRWVWHRSLVARDARGRAHRLIGSIVDITAEREAREAEAMVARELDHRVKNTFALIASIVTLTAARHPAARDFAGELRERLQSLAAAHDVVRRGAGDASLHDLLRRLAAPHADAGGRRFAVSGDDVALLPEAVPHLGLILHEWLTNAAKYGALSAPGGRVEVEVTHGQGTLLMRWRELGGPAVQGPPAERGFGSLLAEATAGSRFGGALEEDWAPSGLRLTLRLAADRVVAPHAPAEIGTAGPSTLSR